MHRHLRHAVLFAALAPPLGLTIPAIAQADTLTVTHDADPVENVPFRMNFLYSTAASGDYVYATIKSAGGAGCGPNFAADQGETIDQGDNMQGSGADTVQITEPQGSYLVCAYEQQSSDQTTSDAPVAASTINVRQIHAALRLGVPATAKANVPFQLEATYSAEQQRYLYVNYAKVAPGATCPQTSSLTADGWQSAVTGDSVQGAGRDTADVTLDGAGTYLFCGWVQQSSDDTDPAAMGSATVTVPGSPPAPPARHRLVKLPTQLTGKAALQARPLRVSFTGDGTGFLGGFSGRHAVRRPSRKNLRWAGHLHWRLWSSTQARATGVVWLDDGTPNDAHGTFHPYATAVHAYRPRNGVFTRLSFAWVHGRHRTTVTLKA